MSWRWIELVRRANLVLLASILFGAGAEAREPWLILKNCQEIANDSNDGDSFHVRAAGKEYIFRLYFVDAPETESSFPERVREQATYFHLNVRQTLQLGDFAKRFVTEKLSGRFTVRTCLQDALGRSRRERFYAFIETSEGDLGELLVANGMARVHGSEATPLGLSSPAREREKLERLEREAKLAKVGAWGASAGRMTARLPKQPSKTGPDSFEAFFHPERVAAVSTEPEETPTPVPAASINEGSAELAPNGSPKLDINTATAEELKNLPGVGQVTAARIIAARPYPVADFLLKVKGIGPKKYQKLRPYFR